MSIITEVIAREILDSRGSPTVEVDVILEDGILAAPRLLPGRPRIAKAGLRRGALRGHNCRDG